MSQRVYCVKPEDGNPSTFLKKAFRLLDESELEPDWIEPGECLKLTKRKTATAFLIDPFEGPVFEHLSSLGSRLYGPPCVLECLRIGECLPVHKAQPIYSIAMKGLTVCCTGVNAQEKKHIETRVKWMGGTFSPGLTEEITHLVAGNIGSKKYQVAGNKGKQIMSVDWMNVIWDACSKRNINIEDEEFSRLRCPIFKDAVVTVSALDLNERQEVKTAVEAEGGRYTGEMKVNECTHLLIREPRGQKYEFARKWKIKVVHPKWLRDSLEKGYCLDENVYEVKKTKKTSTPSKDNKQSIGVFDSTSNMSTIHNLSTMSSVTTLDETVPSKIPNGPFDKLDISISQSSMFLDGCKIFLSGFNDNEMAKLLKVINLGGGTRFSQINESVSHVVIGERVGEHVQQLKTAHFRPHIVSVSWLIESFQKGELLPERQYTCLELPPVVNPMSPPPVKRTSFAKPAPVKTAKPATVSKPPSVSTGEDVEDDMHQLLSQYMPGAGDTTNEVDTTHDPDASTTLEPEDATKDEDVTRASDVTRTSDVTCNEEEEEDTIFMGFLFVILGFDAKQERELGQFIKDCGGAVRASKSRAVPDYGIVPVFGCDVNITVKEVVTNVWMQMCVEACTLLPVDSDVLFRPVPRSSVAQPLKGCVICISSFDGTQRDCLLHIAEELGARVLEYFQRKKDNDKNSTHLLIGLPDGLNGQKYKAALKWGVHVVTKEWLLQCCSSGIKVAEDRFSPAVVMEREKLKREQSAKPKRHQSTTSCASAESNIADLDATKTPKAESKAKHKESISETKMEQSVITPKTSVSTLSPVTVKEQLVPSTCDSDGQQTPSRCSVFTPSAAATCSSAGKMKKEQFPSTSDSDGMQTPSRSSISTPTAAATCSGARKMKKEPFSSTSDSDGLVTPARSKRLSLGRGLDQNLFTPMGHSTPQAGQSDSAFKTPIGTGLKSSVTPRSLRNQRIKQLQEDSMNTQQSQLSPHSKGIDSPSKFLDSKVEFQPSFDLTDAYAGIVTPSPKPSKVEVEKSEDKKKGRRSSTWGMTLDEMFCHYVDKGLKTMVPRMELDDEDESQGGGDAVSPVKHPLRGVVLVVSKKLNAKQSEFHSVAASLGADYRWTYDQACTHFIYQGRSNDNSKEYKLAKEHKKFIISPHWLTVCKEQNARVDESLFPHNYNPNMTLSVTTKGDEPSKGTRRSTRNSTITKAQVPTKKEPVCSAPTRKTKSPPAVGSPMTRKTKSPPAVVEEEAEEHMDVDAPGQSDEDKAVEGLGQGDEDENNSDSDNNKPDNGTGSLEMQEAVSKQLEDFMAATKGPRPGRRMSKRFNSNGSEESIGSSADSTDKARPPSRPRSKLAIQSDSGSSRKTRSSAGVKTPEPECSQHTAEVTWDDPTGRQEQEKLASVLHKPYSPTQESLSPAPPACGEDLGHSSDGADYASVMALKNFGNVNSPQPDFKPPPTPEAPPLGFPRPKPPATAASPEDVTILDDEEEFQGKRKFMFSGIQQDERTTYAALVEQLGGTIYDDGCYDKSCTHLIAGGISKNEKYLSCVAAGKWILHKSYLEACREAGTFVKERDHVWGSESTSAIKDQSALSKAVAEKGYWWFNQIRAERKRNPNYRGAFQDWRALLCAGSNKMGGFKRLLEAGGATVSTNPAKPLENTNYAFIDTDKVDCKIDYKKLVEAGVYCLKPSYIGFYLQSDPAPKKEQYYVPEARPYLSSLQVLHKRKSTDSGDEVGKRFKR